MRESGIGATMMDLGRLVEAVDRGRMALPEFQRDFDWQEDDVRQLLVTVLSGWPAGSLLFLRGGAEFFRLRPFETTGELASDIEYVVLDGQQRLTALHAALKNHSPSVYAISLDDLGPAGEIEDAVVSYSRTEWEQDLVTDRAQGARRLLPCYELNSASQFFEWRDRVVRAMDDSDELRHELTAVYRNAVSAIHRYEFPVVILEQTVAPAAIARIFERVNRLGMYLGTFDLMVAKVFDPTWNLRDQWEEARADSDWLEWGLADDGMPLLQTIAMVRQGDIRQSAVLKLSTEEVQRAWPLAVSGVERGLEFMSTVCGVATPSRLPYKSFVVLYGALGIDHDFHDQPDAWARLFWSKAFAQSYDAAANTRLVADYRAIRAAHSIDMITFPEVDLDRLYYAARRSHKSIWAGFVCLLQARDPDGLFGSLVEQGEDGRSLRVVSILERDREPELPELAAPHLRVLSLVQVPPRLGKRLEKYGIAVVAQEMAAIHGAEPVEEALAAHLLPPLEDLPRLERDWQELFRHRVRLAGQALGHLGVVANSKLAEAG